MKLYLCYTRFRCRVTALSRYGSAEMLRVTALPRYGPARTLALQRYGPRPQVLVTLHGVEHQRAKMSKISKISKTL